MPGPEHGMMFILAFDDTEFVAMDYTTVAVGFRVGFSNVRLFVYGLLVWFC